MKKNENIYTRMNKILFSIIISIFIIIPFILNFKVPNGTYIDNSNKVYKSLQCILISFEEFDLKWTLMFFIIYYFVYNTLKEKKSKKQIIIGIFISLLFTTITMIGKALSINDKLDTLYKPNYQIFKSIFITIGYFFLYYILYSKIIKTKIKLNFQKKNNKISKFFDKHQTIISIILISITWLPLLIIYYPGVASGDTLDSLAQFFNVKQDCWSAKAIILKNNNVILNKHHSVLFTLIFGIIVKIGYTIQSYNLGMFLFIIIQTIILIICFTFLLYYLKKISIPVWFRILSLLYICLCPLISGYSIAAIKDTLGAILIMMYNIFLLQIIRNYNSIIKNKISIITFMIIILLILMIKSNSMFIILTSYISLLIYYVTKNEYIKTKKLTFVLILPLIIFLTYDKIILTSFDVTGTNKKESYSIPFMQIARLANRNDKAISKNDKKIIDKVLNYEAIKRDYTPRLSDPVKNTYKKNVTEQELNDFWQVYYKYLKKYPKIYIASIINSTYGYYFPEVGETEGIQRADTRLNKSFNIKNKDEYIIYMKIHQKINEILTRVPFFNYFNHVAYYIWFLIFSIIYIIRSKKNKYLIPLVSLIAIVLSSLISPVNGSFRYILALVFSIPILCTIDYLILTEKK